MRKARRVFLGNSLTTNLLAREDDVIIDFWEGGSDLYGWSLGSSCLDRIPVFLRRSCCQQLFGSNLRDVDVEIVIEGFEANVAEKLGDISRSFIGFSGKVLVPEHPVCAYYRRLLTKSRATRVFSPISKVSLQSKHVKTYHYEVEYEELVNTLPLHYFLSKSGLNKLVDYLEYSSAHALLVISDTKLGEYTKVLVGHKGHSLGYVVSYGKHPLGRLIYAFIPIGRGSLKAELASQAVVELKRLKLIEGPVRLVRPFFIKYFRMEGDVGGVQRVLKDYGVILAGRYGRWLDVTLCDICP
ncbi:MAG: hypothetical protein QXG17_06990 [Sulfolobales archaeon]